MELAVAGEDADRPGRARRHRREQAHEQLVSVGRKNDGIGAVSAELAGDMGLGLGPDLVHHLVPLAIGKAGGVVPRLDLPLKARVRPEMVTVRREMQPPSVRRQAAAEQRLEAQRAVLSDHNSGKTRFSSVARR